MRRQIIFSVIGLAALAVAWLPVTVQHDNFPPKAGVKYIRRVFGRHTVGQQLIHDYPFSAIAVAVRSEMPQTVTLRLLDEDGRERGRRSAALRPDEDTWVAVPISPPVPPGVHTFYFAGLPDTSREEAALMRFQIDSDLYPAGYMVVDGEPSYGDIGFRTLERVPLWRAAAVWGQITDTSGMRGVRRIIFGVILAGTLWCTGWLAWKYPQHGRSLLLALLMLFTIAIRLPYLQIIEGVFGGDAFNYLSKTQALLDSRDPFAQDFRKGPLYSLLLVPGFFMANPLYWSRLVGIAAAAAAVGLLALLARSFSLPWSLAALAGILLAVNPDFIWESPSGLANTLYAALVIASAWAYVRARERRWQWVLAVMLGLTFLARYEGGAVAAVLLPALWLRERLPWRRIAGLTAVAGVLILLPQVSLLWSGQPGIRTTEDILADDGLWVARSVKALLANVERLRLFTISTWADPDVGLYVLPALLIGLAIGALLTAVYSRRERWQPETGPAAAFTLAALIYLVFTKSEAAYRYLAAVPWLLIGLGVAPWVRSRRYDTLAIALMLAVQTAIITVILPKPRYYLHIIPFLALAMVFGIRLLLQWNSGRLARVMPLLFGALLSSFFLSDGADVLARRAEKYNVQAEYVTSMLLAVQHLRTTHGNLAFLTSDEQTIVTFIPQERRFLVPDKYELSSAAQELHWLQEHDIRYAVERNDDRQWQSARAYPEVLEHVHTFLTINGESRVLVYLVHQDKLAEAVKEL